MSNIGGSIQEHTKIVFLPGPKVGELLINSKLNPIKCNARSQLCYVCLSQENPTHCMVKNYVYPLTCSICREQYVGESGRLFRVWMREHLLSVANKASDHAMGALTLPSVIQGKILILYPLNVNLLGNVKTL